MGTETVSVRCCIAGGGPAGMMLGFLLARAGVDVVVLEKHADFLRDFRGDTIHPSTLEVCTNWVCSTSSCGCRIRRRRSSAGSSATRRSPVADFSHLPTQCKFIAFMPQWDFLDFLAEQARRYPGFQLRMQAEVTDLIEEGGRVVGRAGEHAGRAAGGARRPGRRRRRPALDGARAGRPAGRGPRRADGRAVVAALAASRAIPDDPIGRFDARPDLHHAQSRRLLAVRVRDPQRRARGDPGSAGSRRSARTSRELAPFLADRVGELARLGRRSSC